MKLLDYKIHDLTRRISPDMLIYPGDPRPTFDSVSTINSNKVNVTKIVLGSHTGTHVDAQWHFLSDGNTIDREALDKFIGEATILDNSSRPGKGMTAEDFEDADIKSDDIVLIYTGTGNEKTRFTYIHRNAAEWLVRRGVKCLGTDTLSIEKHGDKDGPAHKILLSKGIGIIENLNSNLKQFVGRRMFLVCLPLPLEGIDGSPARAILLEIIK